MHNTHIVEVSGHSAVTLGHRFKDDVVVHNFWGRKVINVLKEKHGWLVGYVILNGIRGTHILISPSLL